MKIEGEVLKVANVPVPRLGWSVSRAIRRADFRSLDFIRRARRRLLESKEIPGVKMLTNIEKVGPVAAKIFETLVEMGGKNNIVPVFVYLPNEHDLREDVKWRLWLADTAEALDLEVIDLTLDLRAVPAGTAARFFVVPWRESNGHYTEAGNRWIAEVLSERLLEIQQIRELLLESKADAPGDITDDGYHGIHSRGAELLRFAAE